MKIEVTAKTNSKHPCVEQGILGRYIVAVKESPIEGKANEAIARALAEHLDVAPTRVRLIRGATSSKKVFEILTFLLFFFIPFAVKAATLSDVFPSLNGASVWPVANSTHDDIESTFGPRIKPSTDAYDWHRGIDIDAPLGAPVLAATSGTLWNVTEYDDGGTTVVLKHSFPTPVIFHDKTVSYFYTLYMHLDSVETSLVLANTKSEHPSVPAGTKIGTVGHSGKGAIGDHLHFEIRVGTQCSLEYQLQNPNSSCSQGFGFDPHVHPMFLFPNASPNFSLQATKLPSAQTAGEIKITFPNEEPILNSIKLKIYTSPEGVAVYEKSLDFNLRDGYDPTTNSALDKVDYSVPYITPDVFNISSISFATNYKIPQSVAAAYPLVNHTYKIVARTIWNDERILNIGGASVAEQSSTNPNTVPTTPSNNVTWIPPTTTPYETSTAITNTPTQTTPPVCVFTTGILVKLPDDGNPATQIDSSVYYYGKDCKRRAFPSSGVYFSWYKDFSAVQIISAETMAQMSLGKEVSYRPGTTLVKFETDPKVYAIDATGKLRWIQTETVAQNLYGSSWNKKIVGLSDASYGLYEFSQSINASQDFNPTSITNEVLTID